MSTVVEVQGDEAEFVGQTCIDWLNKYYIFAESAPLTEAETTAYYDTQKSEHELVGKGYSVLVDWMQELAYTAHLNKQRLIVVQLDNKLHFSTIEK